MMLLAVLVFLALFLWAFAARGTAGVAARLGGGAATLAAAAWGLQQVLLS